MSQETITQLTAAFDVDKLVTSFIALAPWVMGVAGVILVTGLIKWGVGKVRRRLSGGMA